MRYTLINYAVRQVRGSSKPEANRPAQAESENSSLTVGAEDEEARRQRLLGWLARAQTNTAAEVTHFLLESHRRQTQKQQEQKQQQEKPTPKQPLPEPRQQRKPILRQQQIPRVCR